MQIHQDITQLPSFRKAVVTIGTFDGVHRGHQQILEQLKKEAAAINGETVIITFHPHPRKVVTGESTIYLINTIEEKIDLLQANGIDHLVIVPFTESFSQLSAADYIEHFLVEKFHPHTVIIGYDHRFGRGRAGDYKLLEAYSAQLGFCLLEIAPHIIRENTVSSTRIREAVLEGSMETANQLLGYPFFFEGTVIKGNQLGRTIGYPTANLQPGIPEKLIPGNGVYAVRALLKEPGQPPLPSPPLSGMMNIGVRPTVDGRQRVIEVNLFDFAADIYDRQLRVYVYKHLRAEQKFNGLDALKAQLANDEEAAREILI